MPESERTQFLLLVIVPLAVLWGLLLFGPRSHDLSVAWRSGYGLFFTAFYGSFMFFRIRNR